MTGRPWTPEEHLLEEIAHCNANPRRSTARYNELLRDVGAGSGGAGDAPPMEAHRPVGVAEMSAHVLRSPHDFAWIIVGTCGIPAAQQPEVCAGVAGERESETHRLRELAARLDSTARGAVLAYVAELDASLELEKPCPG